MKSTVRWFLMPILAISVLTAYGACNKKKAAATNKKSASVSSTTQQKTPSRQAASTPAPRAQKQTTCQAFCSKMKQCVDDVAAYEAKGKGADALAKAKAGLQKEFGDLAKCAAGCEKNVKGDDKKNMAECAVKANCKDFVACLRKHD